MSSGVKYFIGNWKMFGIPSSIKIIDKINWYFNKDKKNNKKYKVVVAPPYTLLHDFQNKYKNKKVMISAQNCFYKDVSGPHTGSISPFMIRKMGIKFIILGHSENRLAGETNQIIKEKVFLALKNNFTVIYCIGENKEEKNKKKTFSILKKQLKNVLKSNYNYQKIIIAYEPVWSIGTGKVPSLNELKRNIDFIKKVVKKYLKSKIKVKILYGGSVDKKSIRNFKRLSELDGFLIGGASKSSKNFIDIIKNFYK
jgi:triosephosphate isomerase